jgi:hypothetical protein
MLKLAIIVGSTRPGRVGEAVARWVDELAQKRRDAEFELVDKDFNLPLLDESIPPLINAYMNLSPTMRTFGTFINHHFGNVEETGIMITLRDIYIEKINRHLASYKKDFLISWFMREH